jgi:hypothetical protein
MHAGLLRIGQTAQMRRKLITALAALAALAGAASVAAPPAQARDDILPKVRVGTDSCGNFNIWVNDQPVFLYTSIMCGPPPA